MSLLRVVTRLEGGTFERTMGLRSWLTMAMGRLDEPRTETDDGAEGTTTTTWRMRARNDAFQGYAQLSTSAEGAVTVLLRDRSSVPPPDDVVLTEPARRDGSTSVMNVGDHVELRKAVQRWIGYFDAMRTVDDGFFCARHDDAIRVGLLRTKKVGSHEDAAVVVPPTAHHRLVVNDEIGAFDDEPDIERALDSRWSDVVEIGFAETSGRLCWSVLTPTGRFTTGCMDAMECLRLHQAVLRGPPAD